MRPNNENVICQEKSNGFTSFSLWCRHTTEGQRLLLPFFLLWLSASKYCSALCSGLSWYRDPRSKDREESDLLERERRKQDFNSCPASVLLRSTALYEVAFQGRIDSRERHGQCSSKRVHDMKARLYIDSNFDEHIFTYLLNRLTNLCILLRPQMLHILGWHRVVDFFCDFPNAN